MRHRTKITSVDELPKIIRDVYDTGLPAVHNMAFDLNGVECTLCEIKEEDYDLMGDVTAWLLLKEEDLTILWTDSSLNH